MTTQFVEGFDPEKWLKFPNQFREKALLWKKAGFIPFPVGFSNLGMCGGVAATALDFFYSHLPFPSRNTPPSSKEDSALFNWIKRRQVESVALEDFWKYLSLMYSSPEKDQQVSLEAWQQIAKEIQVHHPVMIGLIRAKIPTWFKVHKIAGIIQHHQVVVWGYQEKRGQITLFLYDPNTPHLKDLKITFDLQDWKGIQSPKGMGSIYAFFKTSYTPRKPPEEISHYA